jgi:hypothetical protein
MRTPFIHSFNDPVIHSCIQSFSFISASSPLLPQSSSSSPPTHQPDLNRARLNTPSLAQIQARSHLSPPPPFRKAVVRLTLPHDPHDLLSPSMVAPHLGQLLCALTRTAVYCISANLNFISISEKKCFVLDRVVGVFECL